MSPRVSSLLNVQRSTLSSISTCHRNSGRPRSIKVPRESVVDVVAAAPSPVHHQLSSAILKFSSSPKLNTFIMFHFLNLLISAMLIFPAIATPLATNTPAIASTNNTLLATVPNPVCDVPATNCPENQDDYLLSWDIVRQFYGPSSAVGLWGRVYFTTCDTCVPITRLDSNDCFEFSYCGNSSIRRRICFDFVNMRAERLLLNANPYVAFSLFEEQARLYSY